MPGSLITPEYHIAGPGIEFRFEILLDRLAEIVGGIDIKRRRIQYFFVFVFGKREFVDIVPGGHPDDDRRIGLVERGQALAKAFSKALVEAARDTDRLIAAVQV